MFKKFDINEYTKVRNAAKQMFQNEKLGDQHSYASQTKLFKPMIDTTRETLKNLEHNIVDDRQKLSDMLIPFTNEIMRANDQREAIQAMPFYESLIPEAESTPKKDTLFVNFDKNLDEGDRKNLEDLGLKLPSKVYENNEIEITLQEIQTHNRRIGQFLGGKSKKTPAEKNRYELQQKTLEKYKSILTKTKAGSELLGEGLQKKKRGKLVRPKRGRGRPKGDQTIVYYNDADDLVHKLKKYIEARIAGNTGVNNTIVDILDELLDIKAISKQYYDDIFKNNFQVI